MATTASTKCASTVQSRAGIGTNHVFHTHTLSANPTANDVIQLVKIPAGATIQDVVVQVPDFDSSTGFAFEIGDGGDTDRFITSSALGQTGGVVRLNSLVGLNYAYTAEDTIDIKMTAAASGTFTAGDIKISVSYTMQS